MCCRHRVRISSYLLGYCRNPIRISNHNLPILVVVTYSCPCFGFAQPQHPHSNFPSSPDSLSVSPLLLAGNPEGLVHLDFRCLYGLPSLGTCFQSTCPFPPVLATRRFGWCVPPSRTWSLGSPISVSSSKFSLSVVLSKIVLLPNSGLAKRVFGSSGISDLLRQGSHSRWCDRDYRFLDPTDRRIAVNRITGLFFENVVRGIRTLDLLSGGATTPPLH